MKNRILSILLTVFLACMLLAGCKKNVGTPEDNAVTETDENEDTDEEEVSGYLFGLSCIDLDNPYFQTLQKSIEMTLKESEDRLVTKNAKGDAQTQNEQIQELIEMGVDAVFVCPVDGEEITVGLEALAQAEIPVINLDTQVKNSDLTAAYIGSDNKNAGYVCGVDLKAKCPDGGNILIFECPTMHSINERITGFEQSITNAGFAVLERIDVSYDRQKAYEQMKGLLKKYPEINAVMCGCDPVALGVLQAIEEAERTNIMIYGVDGSPDAKTAIAEKKSAFVGTGAQSPINIGKDAVKTGLAILEGKDYEEKIEEETFLINKDNIELYGRDGWQ